MPDDPTRCVICGKAYRSVCHHARRAHGIGPVEYRDMIGVPRGAKLTDPPTRERWRALMLQRIAAGTIGHYFQKASAAEAAAISTVVKREMIDAGRRFSAWNMTPRDTLLDIVQRAENGERPYALVRAADLSWSAFWSAIRRHPDLYARYAALPIRRGRSDPAGTVEKRVLAYLETADHPMPMADVAQALVGDREASSVSAAVTRLEKAGAITVTRGARRAKIIGLSPDQVADLIASRR